MNRLLMLLLCFAAWHLNSNAQTNQKTKAFNHPNEISLVTDSSGKALPYENWKKLLMTGEYLIKQIQVGTDSLYYVLNKLSKEEIAESIANMPQPDQGPYFTNGEPIKPFAIKGINKFKFLPEDWAGKIVVINFWFINCLPCRVEIPELNNIVTKYLSDKEVVFIAICLDPQNDVEKFIKDTPFTYQQVVDGKSYADSFGIQQFPVNVIIDKQGIVRYNTIGYGPHWVKFIDKVITECQKPAALKQ
ncbi:TlpA family protein disulfide reductase [Mucilaginibacter sp. RCC_168]|uniref:TlpA family protein disulfide reductase n=1 Tax=Mucilaginibacter sp. RCC_168 TaxID=3239221 RepID=UPI00352614CA